MNTTQINAMRNFWESANAVSEEYTAVNFELQVPHSLGRTGDIAYATDGRKFVWNKKTERWTRF